VVITMTGGWTTVRGARERRTVGFFRVAAKKKESKTREMHVG